MSDDAERLAKQKALEAYEADRVANRIRELGETPIRGNFDAEHLRAVHAYLFQDLPRHQPGVTRGDTKDWTKHRELEGQRAVYDVPYLHKDVDTRITEVLRDFGGAETLKGLSQDDAASRIAKLYGDLDHAHGFYEGNSRTLREFTRELAAEAGLKLEWTRTGVGTKERNELYVARDLAVLERAYPDLTPERALKTDDRREYEASFILDGLRRAMGEKSLTNIIGERLTPQRANYQAFKAEQVRKVTEPTLADRPKESYQRPAITPKSAVKAATNTAIRGIDVIDKQSGQLFKLGDFILGILAGPSRPPAEPARQTFQLDHRAAMHDQQQRVNHQAHAERTYKAIMQMYEDMNENRPLSSSDVQYLPEQHLLAIKQFGDNHIQQIIEEEMRRNERYWKGLER